MIALGLVERWIPDAEDKARCNVFISDLTTSKKLLIILQNQVGQTLCLLRVNSADRWVRNLDFGVVRYA